MEPLYSWNLCVKESFSPITLLEDPPVPSHSSGLAQLRRTARHPFLALAVSSSSPCPSTDENSLLQMWIKEKLTGLGSTLAGDYSASCVCGSEYAKDREAVEAQGVLPRVCFLNRHLRWQQPNEEGWEIMPSLTISHTPLQPSAFLKEK